MKIGLLFIGFAKVDELQKQLFQQAKAQCDYLVVGLQLNLENNETSDSNASLAARYLYYKSCSPIDKLVPYFNKQDQEDLLRSYGVSVYFIHENIDPIDLVGRTFCEEKGIKIYDLIANKDDGIAQLIKF